MTRSRLTRRRVLATLGLSASAVAGCSGGPQRDDGTATSTPTASGTEPDDGTPSSRGSSSADSVPMFRYDAANTGFRPSGTGPTGTESTVWSVEIGGTIRTSPAVVGETVYIGTSEGSVHALDVATGDEVWSITLDGSVWSSPAVVDGVLYVGTASGTLHARDVADGTERWQFSAPGPVNSSPTVVGDTVVVGADGGTVHALDVADGAARWEAAISTESVSARAAGSSTTARFSAETGVTSMQATSTPVSTPAVTDDRVYVASDTAVYALDSGDGEQQWSHDFSSATSRPTAPTTRFDHDRPGRFDRLQTALRIPSSPAVVDDVVYVGSTPGLTAVDADNGQLRWRSEAATAVAATESDPPSAGLQTATTIDSSPSVTDDGIYVGGDSVVGVERSSGDRDWQQSVPDGVQSSPAVVDDVVYVGTGDGRVLGLGTASGTEEWSAAVDAAVASSPAVSRGTVYVGTTGGTLYALE